MQITSKGSTFEGTKVNGFMSYGGSINNAIHIPLSGIPYTVHLFT